jgi:uncharacterized protein YcgI (DUF1989 family)
MSCGNWNVQENLNHANFDQGFYEELYRRRPEFKLKKEITVPARSGKGFVVKAGEAFRIVEVEGPQICDLWLFNRKNPKEHFWSNYTMVLEGVYLKRFGRLWSNMPWFRPMATFLEETVRSRGGFPHIISFGSHCTSELWQLHSGIKGLNACHINGLNAIKPFGLTEEDLHDNLNVHMKVKIDPNDGQVSVSKLDCVKGDYAEFYAEMDMLLAVSTCPLGEGSYPNSMPEKMIVLPVGIEIYETGIKPRKFPKWYNWRMKKLDPRKRE